MTARSAAHTSFVLERRFQASRSRVYRAWSDPEARKRWSDCHAEVGTIEHILDFRPGGRETHRAILPGGALQRIDKTFLEIVPDARIIFAYAMEAGGRHLSASLVTVEFEDEGAGTLLRLTEQLAYLDGHDDLQERIKGTAEGLDRLMLEVEDLPAA
jgi:uncharacterized protein YndB with AHSA1/START domain